MYKIFDFDDIDTRTVCRQQKKKIFEVWSVLIMKIRMVI